MVKQGSIIKINFNPQSGHEQAGYRPALVVSNDFFNKKTNMTIVCPITNTHNKFLQPLKKSGFFMFKRACNGYKYSRTTYLKFNLHLPKFYSPF